MGIELRDRIAGKLRDLVVGGVVGAAPPLEHGRRRAAVLAIASSKGGVGKTTTAVNLSAALGRAGLATLLIDLDPQAHVAASLRAPAPPEKGYLSDVLLGRLRDVCEVAYPAPVAGLSLAGSDKQLGETEMILSAKIGKELILAGALEITRTRYDVVVLDCPPNVGTLTLNALCAADHLLIPSDMSVLALEGVGDMLAAVDTVRSRLGRSLEVAGILATRYDRRATRTNETVVQSFDDLYGGRLLATRIPALAALNKAHMAGRTIFDFDARSPGAAAHEALAAELGPRLGLRLGEPALAAPSRGRRVRSA